MNRPGDRPGRPTDDGRDGGGSTSPTVSVLTVPALFGGLVLGFMLGYWLVWWGALVVVVVAMAAFGAVVAGRERDAATALILGTVLGYGGVLLLAAFRGGL